VDRYSYSKLATQTYALVVINDQQIHLLIDIDHEQQLEFDLEVYTTLFVFLDLAQVVEVWCLFFGMRLLLGD
jgi:predicted transcriptional regulator